MGHRGELWVVIQAVLLILLIIAPSGDYHGSYGEGLNWAGWLAIASGGLVLVWSALCLGRSLTPMPRPVPNGEMITNGPYRLVRHPIYLGALLACFGFALVTQSPVRLGLTVVLFIFFDLKARHEERWLSERYPEYVKYKDRVKKIIPWAY